MPVSGFLGNHRFKTLGTILSLLAILMFLVLKVLNFDYEDGWEDRIFIMNHFIIILSFFMRIFSREANDDERVKHIRFSLMRLSLALMVTGILLYLSLTILDRVEGSLFVIIYILEIVLLLYQVLFAYCMRYDPEWLFRERSARRSSFTVMAACLIFLIIWIIYVVISYRI